METTKFATELTGTWYGVRIPSWLRAFDCRLADGKDMPKAPWGATLWSGERAQVDLGLRGEDFCHSTIPVSCSTYIDARTCSKEELAKQVRDAIKRAIELRKEYEDAKLHPPTNGQGGSGHYVPVAIEISNFGWSVIADRRVCAVRGFAESAHAEVTSNVDGVA